MVLALLVLGLGGAAQQESAKPQPEPEPDETQAWFADLHKSELKASLAQDLESSGVARAASRFGVDLLRQVMAADRAANHLVAPLGSFINLSLAAEGASPAVRERLGAVLHIRDLDRPSLRRAIGTLRANFAARESAQIDVASSVWLREGLEPAADFVAIAGDGYGAKVSCLDFTSPKALETINAWGSAATRGAIPKLFSAVDPATPCLLATATHFDAVWELPFPKEDSKAQDFTDAVGHVSQTMMMNLSFYLPYVHDAALGAQIVGLSCETEVRKDDDRSAACWLYVVLPDAGHSLDAVLGGLSDEPLSWRFAQLVAQAGHVALPRFDVDSEISLNEAVDRLVPGGVGKGGLSGVARGESLDLDIRDSSRIRVDEEGVRFVSVVTTTIFGKPDAPAGFSFIADRPFLYFLFDRVTGTLLCAGVLAQPG